jgi:hypothetical protein
MKRQYAITSVVSNVEIDRVAAMLGVAPRVAIRYIVTGTTANAHFNIHTMRKIADIVARYESTHR